MNAKPILITMLLVVTSPIWIPTVVVCLPAIVLTWLLIYLCSQGDLQ